MKPIVALCLLLASSCMAFAPIDHVNFVSMFAKQHAVMRSVISTYDVVDESELINYCFNDYLAQQTAVLGNYNNRYNLCFKTSSDAKSAITKESDEKRGDLLLQSSDMCESLQQCDRHTDGLEFFDCYRNASSDSYKVMFMLNSDAIVEYNTISAKYNVIDNDLTACVEDARIEYAKNTDTCDENFKKCMAAGKVETTSAPGTVTTEEDPVTTEGSPVTEPTTKAPVTEPGTTEKPETEPTTEAPVTEPETKPTTEAPVTEPGTTEKPETDSTTEAPVTEPETTEKPETDSTTEAPVTEPETTEKPETEPTTEAPVTEPETTEKPETEPTIPSETTFDTETTEHFPEEDLSRGLPRHHKKQWNLFKHIF